MSATQTWTQIQSHTSCLDLALVKALKRVCTAKGTVQRDCLVQHKSEGALVFAPKPSGSVIYSFSCGSEPLTHNVALNLTGQKKRLRNIILVLEARNKSVFLNTFMHPEAARGWLPGGAAQLRRVRETAAIMQQSPGLIIAALLRPCSPHILAEEDLFASEGIWEFSLYIQLAHKSWMLSK